MPYDSEGNFTRIHNWEDDRINDIDIVTDHHDEEDDNFAEGLSNCFLRDGRVQMQGNLNAGGFKVQNMAKGTLDTDAVNLSQLDQTTENLEAAILLAVNKLSKLGDIKASLQTANHDNWFLCDGQAISRTEYSELFDLIGTNFGAGDGVNTFNLPDYRGKFLRGLGEDSEEDFYTTQEEGLPEISGTFGTVMASGSDLSGAFDKEKSNSWGGNSGWNNGAVLNFKASKANKIYGASEHVTPINQAVNYFIKVKEEA